LHPVCSEKNEQFYKSGYKMIKTRIKKKTLENCDLSNRSLKNRGLVDIDPNILTLRTFLRDETSQCCRRVFNLMQTDVRFEKCLNICLKYNLLIHRGNNFLLQ